MMANKAWRISIEDIEYMANSVCEIFGESAVGSSFLMYDATCLDDLCPSHYEAIYSDLLLKYSDR
jgi:hypothetical protein